MTIHEILTVIISSMLVNNIVLTFMLGTSPLCTVSTKFSDAAKMGLAMIIIMSASSIISWWITIFVLVPLNLQYLHTLIFLIIIVSIMQLADMITQKMWPVLYDSFGRYLPLIGTNCAVLAIAIFSTRQNPVTGKLPGLEESFINGVFSGVGFLIAIVLMAGIRQKVNLSQIPKPFRGLPISFLSAGLMSLAFLGFTGFSFDSLFGG